MHGGERGGERVGRSIPASGSVVEGLRKIVFEGRLGRALKSDSSTHHRFTLNSQPLHSKFAMEASGPTVGSGRV